MAIWPLLRPLLALPLGALLLCTALAPGASAQLDLPRRSDRPPAPATPERPAQRGDVAPHLVCDACGERNYTAPRSRPLGHGAYEAFCQFCRRQALHRDPAAGRDPSGLELPGSAAARRQARSTARSSKEAGAAPEPPPRESLSVVEASLDPAPRFVLQTLALAGDDAQHSLVPKAIESLTAMGDEGLRGARVALFDSRGAFVIVGARVLLREGDAADAERVVERLRRPLPRRIGPLLLDELLRVDPVRGSPALLVELLDSDGHELRTAAHRHLMRARGPELVPHLPRALRSRRVDTRSRATELLAGIDDPGVLDLLLEHHSDSSPRVAARITEALGRIDGPRVELELLSRAFQNRWILRESAYALLAIIDREDRTIEPILDEAHVETLLKSLGASDAFVAGASAAALAGIGFRGQDPERSPWLDRQVTDRLVYAISGREFHHDFSSLLPRVERRLRLLTGKTFGMDGPAWVAWWIESRDGFFARRAWLPIAEPDAQRLALRYREAGEGTPQFTLLGPEAEHEAGAAGHELYRLSGHQVRDLVQLLEREGALGPERLPGLRGSQARGTRVLEIVVGSRGKSFEFGPRASEPWFERLAAACLDLRERNRWQRYPDLARFASEREFWEEEGGWWSLEEPTELERARRLKGLVLGWMPRVPRAERIAGVAELERLYARGDVAAAGDMPLLLSLLDEEIFMGERAARLAGLALAAGLSSSAAREPGSMHPELARELVAVLQRRFGAEASRELGLALAVGGTELLHEAARDGDPVLRAAAAGELGRAGGPADAELLMTLLEDPEPKVEAAAVQALGEARVEAARTDLLVRARIADPPVRAAALRAIGELGGDYVLDALVLGLAERNTLVQEAAAEGLASLCDPGTAPLFVSLLAHGPESPIYAHAVRGIDCLGPAARGDLERVALSPLSRSRRAATLLLAARLDPVAIEPAIEQLEEHPADGELAFELCVLSCVDFRKADDPAATWRAWWRDVDRRAPGAWLRAAMDRRGIVPPSPKAMAEDASAVELREGVARAFLALVERPEDFLVERGRRELERLLGEAIDPPPAAVAERAKWLEALRARVEQRFGARMALPG